MAVLVLEAVVVVDVLLLSLLEDAARTICVTFCGCVQICTRKRVCDHVQRTAASASVLPPSESSRLVSVVPPVMVALDARNMLLS